MTFRCLNRYPAMRACRSVAQQNHLGVQRPYSGGPARLARRATAPDDSTAWMRQPETSNNDVVVQLLPKAQDEGTPEP